MRDSKDLEKSLRKILGQQLRELVRRCAPTLPKADQGAVGSLLEEMISSWATAESGSRRKVLDAWLAKIAARTAGARAVKGVKSGSFLVSASRSPYRLPGKVFIQFDPRRRRLDPSFDILNPKRGKKADSGLYSANDYVSVNSARIADLLGLETSEVEEMREKLRPSKLDFAFLGAGWAWDGTKSSGRRPSVSKVRSH